MKSFSCLLVSVAVLGCISTATYAHHAASNFDSDQVITLTGSVARVEWVNPHVYIYIDEEIGSGEAVRWEIEAQPPAALRRMGWSRDMLNVGDSITVRGNPARDASVKSILGQLIEKSDGILYDETEAMIKLSGALISDSIAGDLGGIWTTKLDLSNYYHFFFGAGDEELTQEGFAARDLYDDNSMNPQLDCLPIVSPSLMLMADTKRITIGEASITIEADYSGVTRTIYMNTSSHIGAAATLQGHSIGRWDGKILVIDTSNFSENVSGNGMGVHSGAGKRLVERLELNEDGQSISYSFELSDPEFIVSPITGIATLNYSPNSDYVVEECSVENARRYLKLE